MGKINLKDKYLFVGLFGFLIGVFVRSLTSVSIFFLLFLSLVSISLFLFSLINNHQNKIVGGYILVFLFVFFFSTGVFRFNISDYNPKNDPLASYTNQNVSFVGIIVDEPDVRESNTKLTVSPIKIGDNAVQVSEKVLVTIPKYPEFQYGDKVSVSGKLERPMSFTTDGNREFDYISYLAKDDIQFSMFMPKVLLLSQGHGNLLKTTLFSLKNSFIEKVESVVPAPENALLGGLVIGAKTGLGKELQNDFRVAGLIHIVVLSGYNITIVAMAMMRMFAFLPRMLGIFLGALSIIFFALMTGGSATTVRASIMALLVILTKITGRTYNITRALIIAGFFMVLFNPRILVFDISFQLSFIATLALIYVSPLLERYLIKIPEKFALRSIISATIATQIFVSPFILYSMGNFSVVAPVTNLLVLPFVPVTMFFGFFAGVTAFVSHFVALPFAFVANVFLSYELFIVRIFSHLPFASIDIPYFPLWLMIGVYVFYVWYIVKHSGNKKFT